MRTRTRILLGGLGLAALGFVAMIVGVYTGWGGSACVPNLQDCSAYVSREAISHAIFDGGRIAVGLGIAFMIAAVVVAVREMTAARRSHPPRDIR